MLYRSFDCDRGYPPRFYRTAEEVKREIREISIKIDDVNERLNIKEMLNCFKYTEKSSAKDIIDDLTSLLQSSIDALAELRELEDTLDKLKAEYLEVSEILGNRFLNY